MAASANMVRNAVAEHTGNAMGILEDTITLNDTGREQTLIGFFTKAWADAPEEKRTAKDLLITLLQQTDLRMLSNPRSM